MGMDYAGQIDRGESEPQFRFIAASRSAGMVGRYLTSIVGASGRCETAVRCQSTDTRAQKPRMRCKPLPWA